MSGNIPRETILRSATQGLAPLGPLAIWTITEVFVTNFTQFSNYSLNKQTKH